ncbi:LOW QUALITY PROTEIN: cohesin subunit SA-3-like [Cyanocitta cristata]
MAKMGQKWGKNGGKMGELLLNCTVRAAGCRGVVTPEMFRELQNSEIIQRLTESFQEASPEYPLSLRSQPWRRFRAGFSELVAGIVERSRHRELLDGFLMDMLSFLTGLSDSQVRAFRHTATLAGAFRHTATLAGAFRHTATLAGAFRHTATLAAAGIPRNLREALTADDCRSLFSRGFRLQPRPGLGCRGIPVPQAPGPPQGRQRLRGPPEIPRLLADFFLHSQLHEHAAYLVDSLWDCAGSLLRDWDTATALLLQPTPTLQLQQEQALLEILSCSGRRAALGTPPPGRGTARKASPRELRQERARLSRCLIPALPRLLQKCLEQVLERIQELFGKHSEPFPVLSAASGALRALSEPQLSLPGLGAIARSRLGDALGQRCQLQVTELLQAEAPDEEDVYGLAATLRRLSALFRDHDLTPWGLYEPCSRLLRRAADTGEVPAQVTIPAISCLFFHLLWELSRIPESGAPPAQLRDFRSRAASFCSLCRSCLCEPQPGLRQTVRGEGILWEPLGIGLGGLGSFGIGLGSFGSRLGLVWDRFGGSGILWEPFGIEAFLALCALLAFLALCDLLVLLGPGQAREPLRLQPHSRCPIPAFLVLCDLLVLLGPGQAREPLRLQPEPELPAQLGAALMDLVFHSQHGRASGGNGNGNSGNAWSGNGNNGNNGNRNNGNNGNRNNGNNGNNRDSGYGNGNNGNDNGNNGNGNNGNNGNGSGEPGLLPNLSPPSIPTIPKPPPKFHTPITPQPLEPPEFPKKPPEFPEFLLAEASEGRLEELQQRRLLLAAFCKLLLQGVLELRAASDVFKHYSKFHGDYGDVIRETLRAARELDGLEWARTLLLSLQQLFTELLLQEGPDIRGLPEFQEIRDLGRRFSLFFSLRRLRQRRALLRLLRGGFGVDSDELGWILGRSWAVSGSPPARGSSSRCSRPPEPPFSGGPPLNLPFLEVLSEFSPRLLRPSAAPCWRCWSGTCRERGLGPGFWVGFGGFGAPPAQLPPLPEPPREPPGTPPAQESPERRPPQLQPVAPQPQFDLDPFEGGVPKSGAPPPTCSAANPGGAGGPA